MNALQLNEHVMQCDDCRQRLRSGLDKNTLFPQAQNNLPRGQVLDHVSPEQGAAYVQNRLDVEAREIVIAHVLTCAVCKRQIQLLSENPLAPLPTVAGFLANFVSLLHECAVLIWPMPLAAMIVVVSVTFIDRLYLHYRIRPIPSASQPSPAPIATPTPISSPGKIQ